MLSFFIILLLTLLMIAYGIFEYQVHQQHLRSIPIRIHINGTRGKSSVTRLIGAGLRAGGLKTITKVTGTFPRLILPDGSEAIIHRKEKANILEQLDIIRYCSQQEVEVLIIECMALQPIYQKITEHQMIKATHGVITNIRLDHLDVMGPRLNNVADAICGTIPRQSKLFTSEDRYLQKMEQMAQQQQTQLYKSDPLTISTEALKGFSYIEHKDNIALALDICADLGVDRATALAAMQQSIPDEGVLRRYAVRREDKRIFFYNALAANDPESTLMIYDAITEQSEAEEHLVVLLNTRKDRQDRAVRLVDMISKINFGRIALIGESLDLVVKMCLNKQISLDRILPIGLKSAQDQFRELIKKATPKTTILAIGNMGAGGAELAQYFEQQHQSQLSHSTPLIYA